MIQETIPARLFRQAILRPSKPAYYVREGGRWKPTVWQAYAAQVRQVAKALLGLGLGVGDTIGILGFNRPEWAIADLAAMCIGGVPAGIYTTCSSSEVSYILRHAGAKVCVVENSEQWAKIFQCRAELPQLQWVITMRGCAPIDDPLVLRWDELPQLGSALSDQRLDDAVAALRVDSLATLIYTSGTTGPPKGVMLSHANLAWTSQMLLEAAGTVADDCNLSYLPLSHIAEQLVSIHVPVTTGSAVYFAESLDKVVDNLREVRPTILFGVPRIWGKLHVGVAAKLADASGVKARLLSWACGVGAQVSALRARGFQPAGRLLVEYLVADQLVFSKLKAALGLDRGRLFISGAAPIGADVLEFFASLDILITEVYGQSEDTGPTTYNAPGRIKLGTVGRPLPGVDVAIADDGEILVRGPNVFIGYWQDGEATAAAKLDGWLRSGDLGAFDEQGFLTITGRKKELIITSGGKNIAPNNLEEEIKQHPLVAEAVVVGDGRKYLTMLICVDPVAVAGSSSAKLRPELQRAIDTMNRELARVATIKRFAILPRAFTVEDGELTPTLKVKRRVVAEHFADEIEAMYQ